MPLLLDRHGWLAPAPGVSRLPSPNCDARPHGAQVSLLVLHNISLPPGQFGGPEVAGLFLNTLDYGSHPWLERLRGLRVSAHFFIRRDGRIVQFVSTDARAWHAGVSRFAGRERCNDFSIGIELEGTDTLPYTDEQYLALRRLTPVLRARYPPGGRLGPRTHRAGPQDRPGARFQLDALRARQRLCAAAIAARLTLQGPVMLKIWGRLTSVNVQKVMLAVRELALPHTFIEAGGPFGVVDTPEYAKINPNRTVPAIDDGGFVLWESNAIVRYLAARYGAGTLWPEDVCLRADADRWMDWQTTEWQGAMVPAFLGLIRTPEAKRDHAAIDLSVKRSNARAQILDQALQGREFIAGRHLTIGDIALVCSAHRWLGLPIERPDTPALSAWYRRVMMRPATQGVLTLPLE